MTMKILPPGTLAPDFESPLSLLTACHDKVRHFAALSLSLAAHVESRGADRDAREAASNILRYFDIAAPLHHADEEEDLFPALRALGEPALDRAIDELEAEHRSLAGLWQSVRLWLTAIDRGEAAPRPDELEGFARLYPAHAAREEAEVYGAAKRLSAAELAGIGARMRQRRGAKD
ncbi:hemerythrin domain-containing protein [Niveibacterium terrae]|uniref:hemerythrin domain-containing protein n=1 Tax=Niveibacterium terrae TaxID=3373598 RepID=UPI003A93B3D1